MKIKVKNTTKVQTNDNNKRLYRLNFNKNTLVSNKFAVGNKVQHVDEKIIGTIKFIGSNEMSILWEDNSRERFPLNTSKLAYIPDIQKRIDPLVDESIIVEQGETIQDRLMKNEVIEKPTREQLYNTNNTLDDIYNKALDDMNDSYDDIEDANPDKQINYNIKEKVTEEIIETMKLKNMITAENEQAKRQEIKNMSDEQFELLKNEVINTPKKAIVEKTEAELMLEKIKSGGAIIGDFKTATTMTSKSFGSIDSNTRNLSDIKAASKNNYNSDYVGELSEDGFSLDFGSDFNTPKQEEKPKLNFENFQNLQGFTKPVQIQNEQRTYKENINSKIAEMDWTILSKI